MQATPRAASSAAPESARGIDERAPSGEVVGGEKRGREGRVREMRVGIGERELHGLDLRMEARLEAVVQREPHEGCGALAVRWQLADLDAPVVEAERLDPFGAMFGEIVYEAAVDAQAQVTVVEKRMQGRDHPVLLGVPETYYLKCLILRRVA